MYLAMKHCEEIELKNRLSDKRLAVKEGELSQKDKEELRDIENEYNSSQKEVMNKFLLDL